MKLFYHIYGTMQMWDTWRCTSKPTKCWERQQTYAIYKLYLAVRIFWMNITTANYINIEITETCLHKIFQLEFAKCRINMMMESMFVIPAVLCFRHCW